MKKKVLIFILIMIVMSIFINYRDIKDLDYFVVTCYGAYTWVFSNEVYERIFGQRANNDKK